MKENNNFYFEYSRGSLRNSVLSLFNEHANARYRNARYLWQHCVSLFDFWVYVISAGILKKQIAERKFRKGKFIGLIPTSILIFELSLFLFISCVLRFLILILSQWKFCDNKQGKTLTCLDKIPYQC